MYDSVNSASSALDWDSVISNEDSFTLLPEGDYNFVVTDFKKERFNGSQKIPACNKAALTLKVTAPNGDSTTVYTDLILFGTLEWKIAAFFRCIGQKKHGEPLKPNWNALVGSTGRARIKIRTYTNKNGNEVQINDVDKFLDPVEGAKPASAQKTEPQQASDDLLD